MITKEKAIEIAKIYLKKNDWNYIFIYEEKVQLQEKIEIQTGKYEDKLRDLFSVGFDMEGYMNPVLHIIYIDAETSEVLYILGPHGSVDVLE